MLWSWAELLACEALIWRTTMAVFSLCCHTTSLEAPATGTGVAWWHVKHCCWNCTIAFIWMTCACLTHWGQDKMAAILQMISSSAFFKMKTSDFDIKFHWNIFLRIYLNMAALVQMMAWCQTGTKPLSEAILICCTDAFMHHSASMS